MAVEYTLLMQKTKGGSAVKSSLSDFGFVVCDIPWPDEETEEVATRTWPGQHGEDAYIPPSGLKLKAYEVEVEFCYKGRTGVSNLLNGTGLGKSGWKVQYMLDTDGLDVSNRVSPWTCDKPYMAAGYSGLGLTTGGIASKGIVTFKSAGWPLLPGKVYTLSFGIVVPMDTDHIDVYLGKDGAWETKATDFKRIYPKGGINYYSLQFTVNNNPPVADAMCVVFNCNDSVHGDAMADYPPNTGIEIFNLKLDRGIIEHPEWTPSSEDVASGSFPEWRDVSSAFKFLRNYLIGASGDGAELRIYDPYWRKGRQNVYVKKIHDFDPHRSNVDEVLPMKVTFRIADPMTDIGVGTNSNGDIISLGAI